MHEETEGASGGAARGPLAGCLVADFSRVLAGPLATMVLGDLGATVVKVEHPRGDDTRRWGPPFVGEQSTYFLSVNRNKRSVVLDLTDDDDLEAARTLARRSTILVENFRPGRLGELGLGYAELSAENPRLVYCSVSGFGGPSTPGARLAGYDFIAQAMSGFMDLTGPEGGPASRAGVAVVDVLTGLYASIGILGALGERDRSGRGQLVEVDLFSCALSALLYQASAYLNAGKVSHALGNRHPSIAPYETLATRDGEIALAAGNEQQFVALCEALGAAELARDPRFATNPGRVAHREELASALEERLASRPVAEWVERLRDRGVPCGPVNDIPGAFADARALGLEAIVGLDEGGATRYSVANPLHLSRTPPTYRSAPPALGRDTEAVRAWLRAPEGTMLGPVD